MKNVLCIHISNYGSCKNLLSIQWDTVLYLNMGNILSQVSHFVSNYQLSNGQNVTSFDE